MTLKAIFERYDIILDTVAVEPGFDVRLNRVRDVNVLVDAITELDEDERLPYWASLWPSSIELARHLCAHKRPCTRVLELGAGLGLPSLVAARLGHQVLATDYEEDPLALLATNAALNGVTVQTRALDLRAANAFEQFPLIMVSDLLYEARQVDPLAAAVDTLLAPSGTLLLADPGRPHLNGFRRKMIDNGYTCTEYPRREATIFEIERTT